MSDTQDQLAIGIYFPTQVFSIDKPEFLSVARNAVIGGLDRVNSNVDLLYPVRMTGDLSNDVPLKDMTQYILSTAWNILQSQGYDVTNKHTKFLEFWGHEHHMGSSMDQHTHAAGAQLSGFYFIDCPSEGMRPIIYDVRAGKMQNPLGESSVDQITAASGLINFEPKPGMLWITNSWVPHSFSRHGNHSTAKFIHFNIGVVDSPILPSMTVEVI